MLERILSLVRCAHSWRRQGIPYGRGQHRIFCPSLRKDRRDRRKQDLAEGCAGAFRQVAPDWDFDRFRARAGGHKEPFFQRRQKVG
jgi:hypothetical protein